MTHPRDHVMLGGHLTRPCRKAKDPSHVIEILCWHFDEDDRCYCYRPIARIARPDEEPVPSGEPIEWRLLALPGYYPDSRGVLYETRHAAENLRYGRAPRLHRPIKRYGERRHFLLSGDPLAVRCSRCDTEHVLHHSAFGVPSAADPREKSIDK